MTENITQGIFTVIASGAIGVPLASRLNLNSLETGLFCAGMSILIGHFLGMK
jgi:hypothetical protein